MHVTTLMLLLCLHRLVVIVLYELSAGTWLTCISAAMAWLRWNHPIRIKSALRAKGLLLIRELQVRMTLTR